MTCVEHGSVEGSGTEVSCPVYEIHVQSKARRGLQIQQQGIRRGGVKKKTKKEEDLGIHGIGRENYTIGTNKNDRPSLHDL